MKKFFLALALLSINANAGIITCNQTSLGENFSLVFDLDNRGVNSMDIHHETVEKIYSRWPAVRGAFTVDYCNPNDNEYRDYSKTYSLYSLCSSSQVPTGSVTFHAVFSIKNGGSISYLKNDGSEQNITFSNCN